MDRNKPDLRHMVYELVLCFKEIEFQKEIRTVFVESRRNGIWLQRNPRKNLLALLAVSRQIYDEARRVFYGRNTFTFRAKDGIPTFLIGIGRENAVLLRSLRWKNDLHQYRNHIDALRFCLVPADSNIISPAREVDIWNDDRWYLNLLLLLAPRLTHHLRCRLLRLNSDDLSPRDHRKRHSLDFVLRENGHPHREGAIRKGTVSFELHVRETWEDGLGVSET